MFCIPGSVRRFCDGLNRRDLLHLGSLAALGAVTPPVPGVRGDTRLRGFGKAKRCILLCLWGSPSQLETFDPKPDAPPEVRGELGSIATTLPGVRLGEI
ncbi:MAG: DUF1501 domain-containing protein, partial [Gemmataceae bacterium]